MYTDLYLKFADEATATSVLYHLEGATEGDPEQGIEPEPGYLVPNYQNIDTLGILYTQPEIIDPENPPDPVPLDGWYVNVRVTETEDPASLESYRVDPEPQVWRRVWG